MSTVFDGNGVTYTLAGLTLKPKTITIPGWEKPEIDVTTLDNDYVRTFVLGALKNYSDMILGGLEFDMAIYKAIPEGNAQVTITLPNTGGTFIAWCDVKKVGDIELDAESKQPIFDVTLKVTNRNGSGTETKPA